VIRVCVCVWVCVCVCVCPSIAAWALVDTARRVPAISRAAVEALSDLLVRARDLRSLKCADWFVCFNTVASCQSPHVRGHTHTLSLSISLFIAHSRVPCCRFEDTSDWDVLTALRLARRIARPNLDLVLPRYEWVAALLARAPNAILPMLRCSRVEFMCVCMCVCVCVCLCLSVSFCVCLCARFYHSPLACTHAGSICQQPLSGETAACLADVLKDRVVEQVYLRGCSLTDEAVTALLPALRVQPRLRLLK
jgi:hypothetical protein